MDQNTQKLFTVLERGDRKIKNAYRKAILLVGLTRAGKSTVFNWFLNKPMIGKGKFNSYYDPINEDKEVAPMSNKLVSMTLDPNMKVNFTEDISLIDMAGFLDNRNYVGVVGVSYFLKAIFEKVREAKFAIVFSEDQLTEPTGRQITKTINGFISMFSYNELSEQLKTKLKKSIVFIITRSKQPENHYGYMQELIQKLKDGQLQNIANKDTVVEILHAAMNLNHVEEFKAAKVNENPPECKIVEHLTNVRGWDFFNLDEADAELGKSFVSLPIQKDFEKLEQKQRKAYEDSKNERLNSYKQFANMIMVLIDNFISNWKEFLGVWQKDRQVRPNHMQMNRFFQEIATFLVDDYYNSEETVKVEFRANYDPPSFITAVNFILRIFEQTALLPEIMIGCQKQDMMNQLSKAFASILDNFTPFCTNNDQELLIARVKYIVERGFIEFTRLEDLMPGTISEFSRYLGDSCQLEIKEQDFMDHFVEKIQPDLMSKMFNTFELIEEYEAFLAKYEQNFGEIPTLRCAIVIAKGDLLFRAGEKVRAFVCYSTAAKAYLAQGRSILDSDKDSTQQETELKRLYIKKVKMTQKMRDILVEEAPREDFNSHNYALQLCQYYYLTEDTFQVYDAILASPKIKPQDKSKVYEEYASYCLAWGRREKALGLLQKKMSQDNDEGYFSTAGAICELDSQQDTIRAEMKRKLREPKWTGRDEEFEIILNEIEGLIVKQSVEGAMQ